MIKLFVILLFLFSVSCGKNNVNNNPVDVLQTQDAESVAPDIENENENDATEYDDFEIVDNYEEEEISDNEICYGTQVVSDKYDFSYLGTSSKTITMTGACGAFAEIDLGIGMTDYSNCIGSVELLNVSWGDNGSGGNAYSKIEVYEGSLSDGGEFLGSWEPENVEGAIQSYSGPCQVGHSIYTIEFFLKFK